MSYYKDNSLSIGNTPLVQLRKVAGDKATVLGKVEGRNPAYSVKCRIGASMVWDAEERGVLRPGMEIERTEIFGPVVIIMKFDSLDGAIEAINRHPYGNGASIYTQNGYYARKFKLETLAGMIGINIGIPAPVAYLPFGGMKASLQADIKAQGKEVMNFFTEKKIITERYWPEA